MFETFDLFSCRPRFFGLFVWENIPKKHDKKVTMDQLNRVCTEKTWKLKTVIKKKDDSEKWKWRQVRPVIDMSQKTWSNIQKMAVSRSGEVHSCASGAFMSKTGRSKFREKPRKTKFLVEVGESLLKVEYARCRRAAEKHASIQKLQTWTAENEPGEEIWGDVLGQDGFMVGTEVWFLQFLD